MVKRMVLLLLLLSTALFSIIAESWQIESGACAYNRVGITEQTTVTKLRVFRTNSSGVKKYLYLLVYSANPGFPDVGNRNLFLNKDSNSETIAVRLLYNDNSKTDISATSTTGTKKPLKGTMLAGSSSVDVFFKVNLPADFSMTAGTYACDFTFYLYESTSSTYTDGLPLAASGVFSVISEVSSTGVKGNVTIIPTQLSFGLMQEQPNIRSAKMYVTASKNFVVYLRSTNLGKLKQQDSTSEIPYTFVITGPSSYSYTADLTIIDRILKLGANATNAEYTLTITTAVLDFPEAGDYSDTLTFTFTQS